MRQNNTCSKQLTTLRRVLGATASGAKTRLAKLRGNTTLAQPLRCAAVVCDSRSILKKGDAHNCFVNRPSPLFRKLKPLEISCCVCMHATSRHVQPFGDGVERVVDPTALPRDACAAYKARQRKGGE